MNQPQPATIYAITVRGQLDPSWSNWFEGFTLNYEQRSAGRATTLTGPIADQSALRGVLCRLWDLNLTLLSVRCLELDRDSVEAAAPEVAQKPEAG